MFRKFIAGLLLATLALTAIAPIASANGSGGKNIVERAAQLNKYTGAFDTLLAAATCSYFDGAIVAELVKDDRTLFAPTDRAFRKIGLSKGNVCETFKDDPDALANILSYHVIDAKVSYRDARKLRGETVTMLNGDEAKISGKPWRLRIDGSPIVLRNVPASNGLIHVVSRVLLP